LSEHKSEDVYCFVQVRNLVFKINPQQKPESFATVLMLYITVIM
jgi:hypothetical protein